MKKIFTLVCMLAPFFNYAQLNYPSYANLLSRINQFKGTQFAAVGSIGKSLNGENIPFIKIQHGDAPKPTLLLVAGIDGKHPAGVINSLDVVDRLLALPADSLIQLLSNKSIWIVPLVNPDAYYRNSTTNIWNAGNARVIDNDRDGRIDEDPSKDLNGDKVIAQMRIKSIAGTHIEHPVFKEVLIEADRSKGEGGTYFVDVEGVDLDFDGKYGEDGDGGVNLDRNFTFDYPAFYPESGSYAASEPETKALMDFVFNHPQISTILHFGLSNNLTEPERFNSGKANERIISSWSEDDAKVAAYVSGIYKGLTKPLGEPTKMEQMPGNFTNTGYYHLGKFSFSTPTWWPSVADSIQRIKAADIFYQWVAENAISGTVLPWTKVDHPNFPNQEVEVGGVVEIFRNNPPLPYLNQSSEMHAVFIQDLLKSMAELKFQEPIVTALGDNIYRVELSVTNVGMMPTYPTIADKIRHVSKFKTVCELQAGQTFLNGKRLQLYPSLGAGKSQTFSWLIGGKGMVSIEAGCPTSGVVHVDVKL